MIISLEDICEFMTHGQRYSWFWWSEKLLNNLTEEEKESIHIQTVEDCGIRIWYPAEKWSEEQERIDAFQKTGTVAPSPIDKIKSKIRRAILAGEFGKVLVLKMELKELEKETNGTKNPTT